MSIPIPDAFPKEQLERRHQLMDSLERAYSEREDQYKVCVVEGLLRKVGDIWIPHTLLMRFWHEATGRPNESFEYSGGARLIRCELPAAVGWALVARMRDELLDRGSGRGACACWRAIRSSRGTGLPHVAPRNRLAVPPHDFLHRRHSLNDE